MLEEQVERVRLSSPDVVAGNIEGLKALFPEVFTEGKIDFDRLRQALGDRVDTGRERYGLSWAGKAEAIRSVQTPSIATLVPERAESVSFDTTQNLFIEGDNLEVLKLLKNSYHGQVKMIYIDPPYNTGNDFVYRDNYRDSLDTYLRLTGQRDGDGLKQTTNTESSGRYHSAWLSMMYPRLYYARQLLREDGVIFVSIDDHEVHNLRLLMNEVFGEENFIACVIWQKAYAPRNNAPTFSESHDYILCYARETEQAKIQRLSATDEQLARYTNRDNDPRGDWKPGDLSVSLVSGQRGRTFQRTGRGANLYNVTSPTGKTFTPPPGRCWVYSQNRFEQLDQDNRIWWGDEGDHMPSLKRFLGEIQGGQVPQTIWSYSDVGHNQEASKELKRLMEVGEDAAFPTPKPKRLIKRMLQLISAGDDADIVLDFFAGSSTTAQAVLELNRQDGGNRRFIMVQLPEPTGNPQFPTIAEIGKERIRRVIGKLTKEREERLDLDGRETPEDLGFRVFKLATSNFEVWDGSAAAQDLQQLEEQLALHVEHVLSGRGPEDLLYEIILKSGFPLTAPVEERHAAGVPYYSVAGGALFACVEHGITREALREMIARQPQGIICLDSAFHANDQLKTNIRLEAESHGVRFRTI